MKNISFSSQVRHVQPGSAVSAGNTSAATRDLESRTNYLKEVVDHAEAGHVLVRYDQPLHPSVQVGDCVYWDPDELAFCQALAGVALDDESGTFAPTRASDCLGMCVSKNGDTSGHIASLGMIRLTADELDYVTRGDSNPGRYYLSAAHPGKLVRQRPPVTVAVAHVIGHLNDCDSDVWVFLYPQMRDFLEDHIHFQYHLVPRPAGSHVPPAPGDPHVITSPDADAQGWLPADHASFGGHAPAGAVFGYNLSAHPELANNWPPIPVSAAILEILQPATPATDQVEGLQRVPAAYVTMNQYGIWWMTDCYNQVPWPSDLDTTQPEDSSGSSAAMVCPVEAPFSLILSYIKMTFATDRTVVTSLRPADGSPLKFTDDEGQIAATGDLYADLNLQLLVDPLNTRGGQVLKTITSNRLTFGRGWVAEGLIAGSDDVILSGSHQELLDPDSPAGPTNPTIHQGLITVDVQIDPIEREVPPQIVKLEDALESEYSGIPYIGFPQGRTSSVRIRFNVPPAGLPHNPRMKLRGVFFGRAAGPFPAVTASYYRMIRPTDGTPTPITSGDTGLTFDVVTPSDDYDGAGTDLPPYSAIEVESSEFTVTAGDTIFVTLSRAVNASPLYTAELGLIRIGGIVYSGS